VSNLVVARHATRRGLLLPTLGTRNNPFLLFPLDNVEKGELDELIRAILAKGGVTDEAEVQAVINRAERDFEIRRQVYEARMEVRRLMALKAAGAKLISTGYRRWRQAFFRPIVSTRKR
jgi:hypothetical protein